MFFLAADGSYFPYKKLRKNEASKRRIVVVRFVSFRFVCLIFFVVFTVLLEDCTGEREGREKGEKVEWTHSTMSGLCVGKKERGSLIDSITTGKRGKKGRGGDI